MRFLKFLYKKSDLEDKYGATVYKTEQDALNGRSSTNAIQKMIEDVGVAILPKYGYLNHDGEVFLYRENDSIIGSKGVYLVSNTNNNMFRPLHSNQVIKGFKANMYGGGSVVYVGGEHKGAIDLDKNGKEYHHWYNRTRINGSTFDFDFNSNYTATPIRLDYSKEDSGQWGDYSHCHGVKIRGKWNNVDRGIVINRKDDSGQSLNTFNIKVRIWGYNKMCEISGISFSKIKIMGQLLKDIDHETFHVKGSGLKSDIFTYVENHKFERGNYFVNRLDVSGYYDLLYYPVTSHVNLNDSKLIK